MTDRDELNLPIAYVGSFALAAGVIVAHVWGWANIIKWLFF
jgi:hypothetical protein